MAAEGRRLRSQKGVGRWFVRCSAESLWPRKNCLGEFKDPKEATVARGERSWAGWRRWDGERVERPRILELWPAAGTWAETLIVVTGQLQVEGGTACLFFF